MFFADGSICVEVCDATEDEQQFTADNTIIFYSRRELNYKRWRNL